jgi:dTDP-4-amino-4,6-dideoxy-D-galactose acyltransferase
LELLARVENIMNKLSCYEFDAFHSPVDSDYFGIASAKVILRKACLENSGLDRLLNFLQLFEFTTIINKANDPFNNHWLGRRTNAFLTDINMQLTKKISITERYEESSLFISDNLPEDDQIIRIAQESFGVSRFLNDPYLSSEKARHIYADITKNAFGKAGRFFVIYKATSEIAGFLLFSINKATSSSVIELIATNQHHKRRGVGKSLLRSMEHYIGTRGVYTVQVGTQLDNLNALTFYTSNGFSLFECNSIYHYWPFKT